MGTQGISDEVIVPPIFPLFLPLQIWSMDSVKPVHSLEVKPNCLSLAWRPNGKRKREDVDRGIAAARKSKENLAIAW